MARTCPDRGSIATAAPILPCGWRCARTAAATAGVQLPLQAQVEGQPQVGTGHGVLPLPSATGTPVGSTYRHCARRCRGAPRRTRCSSPARPTTSPGGRPGQRFSSSGVATPGEAEDRPEQRALRIRAAGLGNDEDAGDRGRGDRVARRRAGPRPPPATAWCRSPRGSARGGPRAGGRSAGRAGRRPRAGRAAGRGRRAPGPRRRRRPRRSRRAARRAGR